MQRLTFGDWLKGQRTRRGLSQIELEQTAELSEKYVSSTERGRIKLPNGNTRARIHDVLGTSDDDLVAVGLLTKSVIPNADGTTRTIYFTPDGRSEEGFVRWNVTTAAEPEPEPDELPPHMRASFLRLRDLEPDDQGVVNQMIDQLYKKQQALREQIDRDRQRRIAEGVEEE